MMAKSELQEDVTDEGASKTLHNFSCVLAQSSSDRQIVYTLGQCSREHSPAIGIYSKSQTVLDRYQWTGNKVLRTRVIRVRG
jgi:hypothetical protein